MISSIRNPKVAAALRLKRRSYRDADGRFLVEGERSIREALRSGALIVLFHTASGSSGGLVSDATSAGVAVETVSDEVMARLTSTVTPPGFVGVSPAIDIPLADIPASLGCVAVLCEVRDPGNAGTVTRAADAAGASAVVFTGSSVDAYNPKTVRASAGSIYHLPLVRDPDTMATVETLRRRGVRVLATSSEGEESLYDLDLSGPVAFLFGNEAHGLSGDVEQMSDATVRVPMSGLTESLNLASAATLCLFEAGRHRERARDGAERRLSDLVVGAAHDLRSPLASAGNLAKAMLVAGEALSAHDREDMTRAIAHDSRRGDVLVQQLVDAARLDAGTLELRSERLGLRGVLEEVAAFVDEDVDLPTVVVRGPEVAVLGDRVRTRNAVHSMAEALAWFAGDGEIVLEVSEREGTALVRAARGEPRVTPAEGASLFEPRLAGSGSGSKLGLYVARGTMQTGGGRMWIEVGRELEIFLELPSEGSSRTL